MNGELLDSLPERAIAVVGMSGRFPGAPTVDQYWANLRAGVCSLREFSREELLADGADPALLDRPDYVAAKGYLEDADRFEAELFGFTRREAALLDPQHRLLLETAWGALEDAGRDPLDVGVRTGVYVGGGTSEHMIAALADPTTGADLGALNVRLLTDKDFLASWISYRLGLDGPAMAVQTACSTSLTAVHVAVQALLLGECDLALAGGVAIDSVRREGYVYQSGGIMSRDGRCRPFSAEADGTVRGNGVGLVALRRLEDAVADGDPIHAVIRGTAAVNDGSDKIGFTAPGERGQFTAMTEALAAADLDPAAIGYIEMHGTATALGDRIEVAATSAAYAGAARVGIGIGSVKSNLGHLDAAAGVAGLIKAALMVRHGEFVPTVNVQEPNPDLALDATPLRIVDTAGAWTTPDGSLRRAGVSSVGLGGSNVHVILEQAPDIASAPAADSVVLPVSARTPEQATATAHALADALEQNTNIDLATAAATLQNGRARLTHRGYVAAKNRAEAVTGLRSLTTHESTTTAGDGALFVFPGQASQYVGMGRELYERFPAFRDALDRCANILRASHGIDPRSWLTAPEAGTRGATEYWQPTIVSVEYAAAELLRSRGVEPAAMVGHSIGEYVAAHLAGVLSLDDALRLVAERGRLMADTPPGAMLAIRAAENDVARLLSTSDVDLAAVNGPESCVVAGTPEAVARLAESLTANRITHHDLGVNYAFHSRLMDDVLDEFRAIVAKEVSLTAPTGNGYISTVSGTWITPDQATDPNFWTDQIRRPVRFADAVRTAGAAMPGPIVEAGPGAGLDGQARRTLDGRPAYPLLGRGGTEETSALTTFGALWLHDVPVTLNDPTPRRAHLPGHHFAGTSYGALSLRPQPAHVPGSDSNSDSSPEPEPVIEESPDLDSVEERIAELLRTTLGVSEPEDQEVSYLAAGGESLTAVHLGGRLRDDFGLEVPITLLLEPIPLRALAKRIAAEGQPPEDGLLASLLGELEAESGAESGE